jgi:hypothetical protein
VQVLGVELVRAGLYPPVLLVHREVRGWLERFDESVDPSLRGGRTPLSPRRDAHRHLYGDPFRRRLGAVLAEGYAVDAGGPASPEEAVDLPRRGERSQRDCTLTAGPTFSRYPSKVNARSSITSTG